MIFEPGPYLFLTKPITLLPRFDFPASTCLSIMGKEFGQCYNSNMSYEENPPLILHGDPEHGGLRFVVIIVLVINLIVGFLLIQLLLNLFAVDTLLIEFATALSCVFSIPFALAISWIIEAVLKREWHSGKQLQLDNNQFVYQFPTFEQAESEEKIKKITFDWSKRITALYWYFGLQGYPRAGRERRVSSKWFGLACQIQQDESRFVAFCYMPPQAAQRWTENGNLNEPFVKLSLADVYKEAGQKRRSSASKRPAIAANLLTSAEGRYWLAEQRRWKIGVELTEQDFETFIKYVEKSIDSNSP